MTARPDRLPWTALLATLWVAACGDDALPPHATGSATGATTDPTTDPTTGPTSSGDVPTSATGIATDTSLDPSSTSGSPPDPCAEVVCPWGSACEAGACVSTCDFDPDLRFLSAPGRRTAAIRFDGGRAQIATAFGLEIYDADALEAAAEFPPPLAQVPLPGHAVALAAEGSLLAVAHRGHGVTLLDLSDPLAPLLLSNIGTTWVSHGVALAGDRLAVADDAGGLTLHDISDPAAPAPLGVYVADASARDVRLVGDVAYLLTEFGGLHVLDLSDPMAPGLLAVEDTGGPALRLQLADDRLYVAAGYSGVRIFDISDPSAPLPLGVYELPDNQFIARDIALDPDAPLAYVADSNISLRVLDLIDPATPTALGLLKSPGQAQAIVQRDDRVWLSFGARDRELVVASVVAPTDPALVTTLGAPLPIVATDLSCDDQHVYLAGGPAGLGVVAVDPDGPLKLLATQPAEFPAIAVDHTDQRAYLALDRTVPVVFLGGLQVYDTSVPAAPVLLGALNFSGRPDVIRAQGEIVYIGASSEGLIVVDTADPGAPKQLALFPSNAYFRDMDLEDPLLAVARSGGIDFYDITSPAEPLLLGTWIGDSDSVEIGSRVYSAHFDGAHSVVTVLDLADPESPLEADLIDLGAEPVELELTGPILWARGSTGLGVHSADDLSAPPIVRLDFFGEDPTGLCAFGDRAFVTDRELPLMASALRCR